MKTGAKIIIGVTLFITGAAAGSETARKKIGDTCKDGWNFIKSVKDDWVENGKRFGKKSGDEKSGDEKKSKKK